MTMTRKLCGEKRCGRPESRGPGQCAPETGILAMSTGRAGRPKSQGLLDLLQFNTGNCGLRLPPQLFEPAGLAAVYLTVC
jgi:hypothetical protein